MLSRGSWGASTAFLLRMGTMNQAGLRVGQASRLPFPAWKSWPGQARRLPYFAVQGEGNGNVEPAPIPKVDLQPMPPAPGIQS